MNNSSYVVQELFFGLSPKPLQQKLTFGTPLSKLFLQVVSKEDFLRLVSYPQLSSFERLKGVLMERLQRAFGGFIFYGLQLLLILLLLERTQLLFKLALWSLTSLLFFAFFGLLQRFLILARYLGTIARIYLAQSSRVDSRLSKGFFILLLLIKSVIVTLFSKSINFYTRASRLDINIQQLLFLLPNTLFQGQDFDRFLLTHTLTSPSLVKLIISDSIQKQPYFSYNFQNPWVAAQMMQSPSQRGTS